MVTVKKYMIQIRQKWGQREDNDGMSQTRQSSSDSAHLVLIGWLSLPHHVSVGEGGDGGRVSGLLSATRTVDLWQNELLQTCGQRQTMVLTYLTETLQNWPLNRQTKKDLSLKTNNHTHWIQVRTRTSSHVQRSLSLSVCVCPVDCFHQQSLDTLCSLRNCAFNAAVCPWRMFL